MLEDLHWADKSTLLLLEFLAERLPTMACLIVGTYRDPPVDVPKHLMGTLSALVRRRLGRLMTLPRHSEPEVATMLLALSGRTPPSSIAAAIHAETEGNAFFVEEVFRHLEATGRLLDMHGSFRGDVRMDDLDVPANVLLVIGQRLDRLTEATRRVLTLGAVIGRRFDISLLGAAAGMDDEALIDALEEAERARLTIPETMATEEQHRFAHELIRHTILARLSPARLRRHHLQVADALERVYAGDVEPHAAQLAHHLWRAGPSADRLKTAHSLRLAGELSLNAAAFEEALRHFGNALAVVPPQHQRERVRLLLALAQAQRSLGRWEDAFSTSEEALPLLESLGDVDEVGELSCRDHGMHLNCSFRSADALAVANRGLSVIGNRSDRARARVLAIRALAYSTACDHAAATADLSEAAALAERPDDRLLSNIGMIEVAHH